MIVDDEPTARRVLREHCARANDLSVIGEFGDSPAALEAIRITRPDLVFLDIQMKSLTGMALAQALDPSRLPLIVFVTAYDDYALEAFEVSAADYLLKPFDAERFDRTLDRVRRRCAAQSSGDSAVMAELLQRLQRSAQTLQPEMPERILAESGGRLHMIDVAQIELIEASRNYVKLVVGREVFHVRSTFSQAERSIGGQSLLKIGRSCTINLRHLREVSRTPRGDFILVLSGGRTVTSSEGYRDSVREHLAGMKIGN